MNNADLVRLIIGLFLLGALLYVAYYAFLPWNDTWTRSCSRSRSRSRRGPSSH